jgi:MFS family permease
LGNGKEEKMSNDTIEERRKVTESVKASLRKAGAIVAVYQKRKNRLLATTIVSSTAVTLVAGVTAAIGPIVGTGTEGWRIACIIAAIFGFVSTVSSGLSEQLKISDRLADGRQGVGKLSYLDVLITTGNKSWEEITQEYEEIAKAYPELIH